MLPKKHALDLKRLWLAVNLPCSKRLKVVLPLWLPGYAQQYGDLTEEVTQTLQRISPSCIDRLLKPVRVKYKGRGKSTTKPGTLLRIKNTHRQVLTELCTVGHYDICAVYKCYIT